MAMDPIQATRDTVMPQIQGGSEDLTLNRKVVWAAIKAAGGAITVHPADLALWVDGTSRITASVDATGAMVLSAV